jgi:hypothetical protein
MKFLGLKNKMIQDNLTAKQKDYAVFLPAISGFYATYSVMMVPHRLLLTQAWPLTHTLFRHRASND